MTPPPHYVLPSPTTSIMGPPPAPRLLSQSTPRLPVPVAGTPPSRRPDVRALSHLHRPSVPRCGLVAGLLLGRLIVSLSLRSVRSVGLVTPVVSVADKSPRAPPPLRTITLVLHVSKPCLLQSPRRLHSWELQVSPCLRPWLMSRQSLCIMGFPLPGPPGLLSLESKP